MLESKIIEFEKTCWGRSARFPFGQRPERLNGQRFAASRVGGFAMLLSLSADG